MHHIMASACFTHGIVLGKAYVLKDEEKEPKNLAVVETEAEKKAETDRFDGAVKKVSEDLEKLASENPIFAAHLAMVQDPTLREDVTSKIGEGENAEQATENVIAGWKAVFAAMDDAYMRERGDDIQDIGKRLLNALQNRENRRFADLSEPSVIVARDLFPSDTAELDTDLVLGFITEEGGSSSHVAIMAKNLGIPALIGVPGILENVEQGDFIAFDASTGDIYVNPGEAIVDEFTAKAEAVRREQQALLQNASAPVVSKDGKTLKVYCNIGSMKELQAAMAYAPDGVGLFRSEFLFMDSDHFPTEEEQFACYRDAAVTLGKELTIRTLDIGGDKALPYFTFEKENNPFLGWRAIRMTLDRPEMFRTQLRAILRASAFGEIRIMFPMIISIDEFERAKALTESAMDELRAEGKAFDPDIPLGMMVETPAAVLLADAFAEKADFFSIGTNDLTQYVLAVDRGNETIKTLFTPFHPAVLRAVSKVIEAAHRSGIEVAMCGEMAGDLRATEILLGLGLDEFSMAAQSTPAVKDKLRRLDRGVAEEKVKKLLGIADKEESRAFIDAEMS